MPTRLHAHYQLDYPIYRRTTHRANQTTTHPHPQASHHWQTPLQTPLLLSKFMVARIPEPFPVKVSGEDTVGELKKLMSGRQRTPMVLKISMPIISNSGEIKDLDLNSSNALKSN